VDACLVIIGERWPVSFLNQFVDACLVTIGERWPVSFINHLWILFS
jgi:hypothetical protein